MTCQADPPARPLPRLRPMKHPIPRVSPRSPCTRTVLTGAALLAGISALGCTAVDEASTRDRHRRTLSIRDVSDGEPTVAGGLTVPANVNLAAARQGVPSTIPMSSPATRPGPASQQPETQAALT